MKLNLAPLCLALLLSPAALAQSLPADGAESDIRFGARVDISTLAQPLLTVSNDGADSVALEIVALDEDTHQHRRHELRLEADGQSVLGFDSRVDFETLVLSGDAPFIAVLEDALGGEARTISVSELNARPSKSAAQCDGTWQLSCITKSCSYTSPYLPGRVENGDQVYWNLHTPTGPWTTIGSGCSTNWYGVQSNGCPSFATNCWGQTFTVAHNIQQPDLIISNVSLSTGSVQSGQDVIVYYDVENIGNATVTPRYQERFLLKPSSGPAYEVYLGSTYGQDIPPGQSVSLAKTVQVTGAAGSYTLQVEADAGYAVAESNENNNITGTPITLTAPPVPQITISGLIYNPGSANGWLFALENCPQGSPCTRTFGLENTGGSTAGVYITDNSDPGTVVTDNCPSSLTPGQTCTITITHTLPSWVAREWGGDLSIAFGVPSQSKYKICIADDDTLCR